MGMRLVWLAAAALALTACVRLSFARKMGGDELRLRASVHAYYAEVSAAFAAGSPDALAARFDPAIARPMTHAQIRAWGEKFFGEHGPAAFKAERVEIESIGYREAVVLLAYRVSTRSGEGDFAGVERDHLVRRGAGWVVASWEKVDEPAPATTNRK